ncbi:hypothetical protein [Microbulbifer sp. JMSA002]|uniref:hypothetical protein n=1 Tax=Microbulbifer sp. JMSA002 TaxID=3243368 RepID=UPI00403962A7
MTDVLSASKGIKAIHEASGVLWIPTTILAIWSQLSPMLIPMVGEFWSLMIVCGLGLLGSIALYQFICFVSPYFKVPPLFPVLSVFMIGCGLIFVFQSYMTIQIKEVSVFTGLALITWGFMLDTVIEKVAKANDAHKQLIKEAQ